MPSAFFVPVSSYLAADAAVLRVCRQAFAMLAREAEKMILTPQAAR